MANSKKRVKAGWKKAKPRRTCCKASPASRNCTNSSGNNEGAKEQKLARGLLWAASCRSSSSGGRALWRAKNTFLHFYSATSFVHRHPSSCVLPSTSQTPTHPWSELAHKVRRRGGVYRGVGVAGIGGTLLRACGRGERAFNKPTLLFRAQIK